MGFSVGHRRLAVAFAFAAHEFDDVPEFRGVALIGGDEGLVTFQTNLRALDFAAVLFWHGLIVRSGGSGTGEVLFSVIHGENLVQAQTAEEFPIAACGVDYMQRTTCILEPPGSAGQHAHEGAVHAGTEREVNDNPLTSRLLNLILDKGFKFAAVLMATFAFDAHPYATVDTACKDTRGRSHNR